MKRVLLPLPFVAILTAILWFGFGKDPSNVPSPLVGKPAPNFVLKSTSGKTVSLKSFRGKPVVVNFFANYCDTCKAEEPYLVQAYNHWKGRVTFLGVIYEDPASEAAAFTKANGGTWPDLIDPGSNVALNYGITGLPSTFFIDKRGIIRGYTVNLLPSSLNAGVRAALRTE